MERHQIHPETVRRSAASARSAAPVALALLFAAAIAFAQAEDPFASLELELVAEGLTSPVALVSPADDERRFVVDQVGVVHLLAADGSLLEEPFLDLRDRLVPLRDGFDERGLLGLAFHPAYAENGRFFVYYSAPLRPGSLAALNHTARVSEFHVDAADPNRTDPESERVVLEVDQPAFNHNGGKVAFGPDGYLYVGLGDGGNANDVGPFHPPLGNGQDVTTLLGAILRIDVDGDDGRGYAVPADNPFVGEVELPDDVEWSGAASGQGARDEIYVWGVRNPFRFSFDRATGDLWIGDVGQNLYEEHNHLMGPGNLGWRLMEGDAWFDPESPNDPPTDGPTTGPMGEELVLPVLVYGNIRGVGEEEGRGISTTGGYVYRGAAIPGLQGQYVFGDWSSSFAEPGGRLFVASEVAEGRWDFVHDRDLGLFLLALGEDADGELYLLTTQNPGPQGETGQVWRLRGGN